MDDFRARIEAWLDTTKAEEHIEKLIEKLSGKKIKLNVDTGDTQKGVEDVDRQIKATTKTTQSFGDSLKKALNIGSAATLIAKGFHEITSAAGKAKEAVKDIDAAIMELRMATNDSYANTLKLVKGYNQLGQQIGATTTEVTDSANSFLRQGKSISETNELIRDSMILSKTANISAADATKYLTSAMKGYKVEAQDAIGIIDKLLATDLISATDAGGLAEGMSKTAVSANMAGVEMETLIGYLATVGEVTQESMSTVGNSFKTMFARFSDIKAGKLKLIDEDGTTETLSDVEQALKNVGINIRSTITDFDDFDDALASLAAKWDTLNSTQQNAIAKAFGGTRQKERFLVLMENYDNAQKYAQAAADSAGIAEQKFSAYADSIEAKSKSLQAAFEALSMDIIPASAYGGVIEATTALVTFLDKTNLVKGSIAGLAAVGTIKLFSTLATGIANAAMQMDRFNSALSMAKSGNIGKAQLNQLIQLTHNLSQSQLKAVISCNTLTNEQRKAILTASGMSAAEADATLSTMGLATAEGAATTTTFTLRGAIKGLWATLMANPLILVATGVAALVSVFASASQAAEEAKQKAEENATKLKESAQAATENRKSIENLISEYKKLADASNGAWSVEDANQLKSIQEQITSLVGDQAGNLDLVNGKIEEEYQKLLNIQNLLSKEELSAAESAYLVSKDKVDKGYQHSGVSFFNPTGEDDNRAIYFLRSAYTKLLASGGTLNGKRLDAQKYLGWDASYGLAENIGKALQTIGSYDEGYQALLEWRDVLNSAKSTDLFAESNINTNSLGDAIAYVNSKISEFDTIIKQADEDKNRFFTAKAKNEVLDYLAKNDITSQQEFNTWIDTVLGDKSISKDYAKSLITAMQSYFPTFTIPDSVKKSFVKEIDDFATEIGNYIPNADNSALKSWLDSMSVSEYEAFASWWKENSASEVVTSSVDSMMEAFAAHMERVRLATNGISSDIEQITANATSDVEKTQKLIGNISAVQGVLSSQTTGISMSVDDYNSEDLKEYAAALEYTNGALQLNSEKVSELVKQKTEEQIAYNNTQKALAQSKYLKNAAEIERLRRELSQYGNVENESTKGILEKISAFQSENDTLKGICTSYDLVTASLMEATSAYQNWINAQKASQTGDMFDSTMTAMDLINKAINDSKSEYYQRFNNENYKAAVGLLVPDTVDPADEAAINAYIKKVNELLTTDGSGKTTVNFAAFVRKAVDAGLMVMDEASGEYKVAAGKTMEDFANSLLGNGDKLTAEFTQALFGEMQEFGDFFDWSDEAAKTIGDMGVAAVEAREALLALGNDNIAIRLDVSDIPDTQGKIDALNETIDDMKSIKGKVNVDPSEVEYANQIIKYCVAQKQLLCQPDIMMVDTSVVEGDLGRAIELLQQFQTAKNNLESVEALGLDTTQAKAELDAATQAVQNLSANITSEKALNIDTTDIDSIAKSLDALTADLIVKAGVDESAVIGYQQAEHDAEGTVTWDNNTRAVDAYASARKYASGTVNWYNNTSLVRTQFTATGTVKWDNSYSGSSSKNNKGGAGVNGTAHASGTAYAGGNWGKKSSGKTLVGEAGTEIVVDPRTGRWYTVGENGAEFRDIPYGAIVFNHKQTESLLKYGYVSGRGTALASGTAMVTGGISAGIINKLPGGNSYKAPSSSASSSTSSSSSTDKNELEVMDWIEIAIARIQRAVSKLKDIASNTYYALRTKLGATYDAIDMVNQELSVQNRAYHRYMAEANSIALSGEIKDLVKNGAIDISRYDSDTQKLIKDYQNWIEKANECNDAVQELHNTLADLVKQQFDSVADDYANKLENAAYSASSVKSKIDAMKEKGYLSSTTMYKSLMESEVAKIATLNQEYQDLTAALNEAMSSGEIEKYSDAWYEMSNKILDVKEELDKANISLIEYKNTIREIEWGYFDYTQERIAQLTKEADFLVDLMSGTKLYQDNGQLSDTGMATMGIYGLNYNTYMGQADQYAAEIKKINAEIAKDPNNTKLIERKEELLNLQRESISAAQQEKQAMIDLVQNGIDAQLASMKKLIDKYNEALDSAKSYNDYQKKIRDQTSELSALNKQLAAYSNDNSEETRAKVQKLQIELQKAQEDLAETEYQQYITDQKKLLDEIYTEYETVLNGRLDNIDALIEDMVSSINTKADDIKDTLYDIANKNGYTISDEMGTVWSSAAYTLNNTLSVYGSDFSTKLTGIGYVLEGIQANTSAMAANSNSNKYLDKDIPAFASGGLAKFTGLAKLDGTPSKPEAVLSPDDTARFIALVDYLKGQDITYGDSMPFTTPPMAHFAGFADIAPKLAQIIAQTGTKVGDTTATFGDININIDQVQDYEDLVRKLRDDDQFEKMIQSMTIDRVVGGNPLNKYRYF